MKPWIGLAALSLAGASVAQDPPEGDPTQLPTGDPVAAPPAPNLPERQALPEAKPVEDKRLVVRRAKVNRLRGNELQAEGDVFVSVGGFDIKAQRVTGNLLTQEFVLEGDASLEGRTETITGQVIRVDLGSNTFAFEQGRARFAPERVGGRLVRDLFVRGADGRGDEDLISTDHGSITTCDLDHPHYELAGADIDVRPGKRAILRDFKLKIMGRTVLGLPYLVVPLDETVQRIVPEVGQTPDEGYFVKVRYSTPLRGEDYFDTRVDYFSKLGLGLGLDWHYENPELAGVFRIYGLTGSERTLTMQSQHRQDLAGGRLDIDANFQQNNYLTSPNTTNWNARAAYTMQTRSATTRLGYSRSSSASDTYDTLSESWTLNDIRRWSPRFRTSLDLNLASSSSGSSFGDRFESKRLDLRFNANQEFGLLGADLLYQRTIPIGDTEGFFSAGDRTPMLTLSTDGRRMLGARAGAKWPFRAELSYGELGDSGVDGNVRRVNLEVGLNRTEGGQSRTQLRWGGRFRQGLYSDDTAQFTGAFDANLTHRFGARSTFGIDYRYLRSQGYTPLALDRTGRGDAFTFDVAYEATPQLRFSANTGYDLLQIERGETPWQQVWLRGDWTPSSAFRLRSTATYDTFQRVWGTARLDAEALLGRTRLIAGARYDGRRSQWAGFSLQVRGFRVGRVGAAALFEYNGYTQQFDAQHYMVTYDMHCTEAVLEILDNQTGFRSGRQIGFYIRLKALPFSSPFGLGRRGEAIGTNSGIEY